MIPGKGILLKKENKMEVVDISDYKDITNYLNCNLTNEIRHNLLSHSFGERYIMIVDDTGSWKKDRYINEIGCLIYGTNIHGTPIYGDAIILKEDYTNEGLDNCGLDDEDVKTIKIFLEKELKNGRN